MYPRDFPGGPVDGNLPHNTGDAVLIPGWGTKVPNATEHSPSHLKKQELPPNPAIPLLGKHPKELKTGTQQIHMHVC